MGVVEQSVEDGVSEGGVADDIVPVLDGELGGEDGAAAGVAIVADFGQILVALVRQGRVPPIAVDEEPHAAPAPSPALSAALAGAAAGTAPPPDPLRPDRSAAEMALAELHG